MSTVKVKVTHHTSCIVQEGDREFEVNHQPSDTTTPVIQHLKDGKTVIGYMADDSDPMDPRDNDNLGTMVCWHSRYNLGDEQRRDSASDFWKELLGDDYEQVDEETDRELNTWVDEHPESSISSKEHKDKQREVARKFKQQVQALLAAKFIMLPLNLLDHSGIAMSTGSFSHVDPGGWDSGQVGWIYVTIEDVLKNWSVTSLDDLVDYHDGEPAKPARERATDLLKAEVEEYDKYLRGECYGVCVEVFDKDGESIDEDACWGFLGHGHAQEEMNSNVKSTVERLTKHV